MSGGKAICGMRHNTFEGNRNAGYMKTCKDLALTDLSIRILSRVCHRQAQHTLLILSINRRRGCRRSGDVLSISPAHASRALIDSRDDTFQAFNTSQEMLQGRTITQSKDVSDEEAQYSSNSPQIVMCRGVEQITSMGWIDIKEKTWDCNDFFFDELLE